MNLPISSVRTTTLDAWIYQNKRFKSLEGVFALVHFLFGCGKQKVLSSHLFIANNNDKCCVRNTFCKMSLRNTFCKMSSSATLHVSAAFPYPNKIQEATISTDKGKKNSSQTKALANHSHFQSLLIQHHQRRDKEGHEG